MATWAADALLLQQVRVVAAGQRALSQEWAARGWVAHWGAPCKPAAQGGMWAAQPGGVAILTRRGRPARVVGRDSTGRWLHVAVGYRAAGACTLSRCTAR